MDKYYTKQLTLALTIIMTLSWIGIYYYFFQTSKYTPYIF